MAWFNGKKGHWGLEGHVNCTEGDCSNCREVACGVQQGFDPVPKPMFYEDPDQEDDAVVDTEEKIGGNVEKGEPLSELSINQNFDKAPEEEKGHWGLEGHRNCTPKECPYDCKEVSCGVKQGFEPVPAPMFYKD